MKCEQCGIFFVRAPCPDCGWNEKKAFSQDTRTIRPSELKGQSAVNRSIESSEFEESLRKPSEFISKPTTSSSETSIEQSKPLIIDTETDDEHLLKPSELRKKKPEVEESLRKPSEMDFGEYQDDQKDHLLKPSQMAKLKESQGTIKPKTNFSEQNKLYETSIKSTSLERNQKADGLLRPSQLKGTSGRASISSHEKNIIGTVNIGLQDVNKKINDSSDTKFKSNVKNTLLEVISLLEKLIEE